MLYVKAEKSPGGTAGFACVVYAVAESQVPGFHDAFGPATLHVTLSAAQTARFTWVGVPAAQTVVPVFAKNTENVLMSPGFTLRKADSNWYSESYPGAAVAAVGNNACVASTAASASAASGAIRMAHTLPDHEGALRRRREQQRFVGLGSGPL